MLAQQPRTSAATDSVAATTTAVPMDTTTASDPVVTTVAGTAPAPAVASEAAPLQPQMQVAVGISPGLVPAVAPFAVKDVLQQAMRATQLQVADVVVHATSQGVTGHSTTASAAGDSNQKTVVTTLATRAARPSVAVKPKNVTVQRYRSPVPADNSIIVSPLAVATTTPLRVATPSPLYPLTQRISRPVQPYATRQYSTIAQPGTSQQRADSPFDTVMRVD